MTPKQAETRGRLATLLFCVFGALGFWYAPDQPTRIPLTIMYALLMVQTWCSLPLFFRLIDPSDKKQMAIDALIGCAYALLAYALRDRFFFFFAWTFFFSLTVLKYSMLVGRFSNTTLLRRKLMANALGVLMGMSMLCVVSFGQPAEWIGLALFAGACVQYLVLRPLYVTDKV